MLVRSVALRVTAAAAFATFVATAHAAVYPPQQQLPLPVIQTFNNSPGSLLQQYPSGGAQLTLRVRDLAASDPSTMPHLVDLLKDSSTTPDQFKSIMLGLVQTARLATRTDQAYADEIQKAIAGTNDPKIIQAYQQTTGDVAIAATGGGGGGGGGSGTGGATGSGFGSSGSSGGASPFGGLHFTTSGTGLGSGGTAGTASSTSTSPH